MESESALSTFRKEWKRELQNSLQRQSPVHQSSYGGQQNELNTETSTNDNSKLDYIEEKAAELFNKGVEAEQAGDLYEAVTFYRKAVSLVPDIERKVHQKYIQEREETAAAPLKSAKEEDFEEDLEYDDLVNKFESLFCDNKPICNSQRSQEAAHISCLPTEMLEKIAYWVVGSELDLESLDRLTAVSRGFYMVGRNQEIWRKACIRVWGIHTGAAYDPFESWREMFLERPRPFFGGAYVARTTYFRSGEVGFEETSQPWHFISYFRYFRFFSGDRVLMLTTSEGPQNALNYLRSKHPKNSQVLRGHYRLHGSVLTMIFIKKTVTTQSSSQPMSRRRRNHAVTTDVTETTFHIEMECVGRELRWRRYTLATASKSIGRSVSSIDVDGVAAFPSLTFRRVRAYQTLPLAPLN